MREICGECKHNKRDYGNGDFVCGNVDSDYYGVPTMYDDTCNDFEEKE